MKKHVSARIVIMMDRYANHKGTQETKENKICERAKKKGRMEMMRGFKILMAVFSAVMFTQIAHAQSPAPSACDPDYYQSLESRAWLEAQREITQNQNLITKPDSVLAYSCFDLLTAQLAKYAREMFSESTDFGAQLQPTSMDQALNDSVLSAGMSYMGNFSHSYRGGRSSEGPYDWDTQFKNHGKPYKCQIMANIWQEAKCSNFAEKSNDGFYTFAQYASNPDLRQFPESCSNDVSGQIMNDAMGLSGLKTSNETPWQEDEAIPASR